VNQRQREIAAKVVCGVILAIVGAFGLLIVVLIVGRYVQLYAAGL